MIAVLINTLNEEKNISGCLERLQWVDEIVVADSGSTDKTVEIAKQHSAQVVHVHPGNFSEIRNAGLKHITSEWVLVVDADEWVTPQLQEEIQLILSTNSDNMGFYIPRKNYFMGRWIRSCGWYPDYVLRLFRNKNEHIYEGKVHESIRITGKIGHLKSPLKHNSYVSLEQYLTKFNLYTTLAAQTMIQKKRKIGIIHLLFRPIIEFIKMYFLKRGFTDGVYGLIIAYLSAMYIFVKFSKAWLMQTNKSGTS